MKASRVLAVLLAASWLGGCSAILGPAERPPSRYLFAPDLAEDQGGRGPILSVSLPGAAAGYGTRGMAYLERDYRLDHFAYSEWVDTPAVMLQPLLARALRARGGFEVVTEEEARGVSADLRLDLFIERVHQDFRVRPSVASVALRAQLVDPLRRELVAARTFSAEEQAPSDDPYGGVVAVNRVLARLLPEVADFAARAAAGIDGKGAREGR